MLAQDLLEAAYNRSSANDPGKLAFDPELLAHLNRVYQRFFAMYALARPSETVSTVALALIGAPATASIDPQTIDIVGLRGASGEEVHLITDADSFRTWHMAPSLIRRGSTLVSRGKGGDPVAGTPVTALVLAPPAALLVLSTVVDARFPSRHYQLLIDSLALYLDTKDDGRSGDSHAKLVAEYGQALAAFAQEYNLPPSALEWAHAPAGRSKGASA